MWLRPESIATSPLYPPFFWGYHAAVIEEIQFPLNIAATGRRSNGNLGERIEHKYIEQNRKKLGPCQNHTGMTRGSMRDQNGGGTGTIADWSGIPIYNLLLNLF